jgi:hypothetical protein
MAEYAVPFPCSMTAYISAVLALSVYRGSPRSVDPVGDADRSRDNSFRHERAPGQGVHVDVIVIPADGGTIWHLTDLLGRSMGNITEDASHQFTIYPEGQAFKTMADIHRGPYDSLDAALA